MTQLELPMRMGRLHAARLDQSPRLQRAKAALDGGSWLSTRELFVRASVCAVNSTVAELRANGCCVRRRCVGQGRYEYQMPGLPCHARRAECGNCENRGEGAE